MSQTSQNIDSVGPTQLVVITPDDLIKTFIHVLGELRGGLESVRVVCVKTSESCQIKTSTSLPSELL